MKNYSIPMALMDFIPVCLFAVGSVILQRDLYHKLSKGAFALFAAGTIDIILAGFLKALYKLLYAAGICDFEVLRQLFFPVMSIGFLLAGCGLVAMLVHNQTEETALSAAPPIFTGTFLFVSCMVVGLACIDTVLSILAVRIKKPGLIAVFVLSFFCSLCMGYLSSRDFEQAYMNWVAQGINLAAQALFLYGVLALHRAGLKLCP